MWGFPKIRGTVSGVPRIRITVFGVLYWGPFFYGQVPCKFGHFRPALSVRNCGAEIRVRGQGFGTLEFAMFTPATPTLTPARHVTYICMYVWFSAFVQLKKDRPYTLNPKVQDKRLVSEQVRQWRLRMARLYIRCWVCLRLWGL